MNRMTVAAVAIALASCSNFDQLEADALDAGRVAGMSGGAAGGMSGGSAGGGAGAGSAGGTSGGSAVQLEPWSGNPFRSRSTRTYAIAASPANGLFVEAYAELDGGTRVLANDSVALDQVVTATSPPNDLDARFGMATVVLNDTLSVFAAGQWRPVPPGGVSGTLLTAPLYRRAGTTLISLYTNGPSSNLWVSTSSVDGGGSVSTASPQQLTTLGHSSRLRVRPDTGGQYGSIVSDTFYARIESSSPARITPLTGALVASSETQQSLIAGGQWTPAAAAVFWVPDGGDSLSATPNFQLTTRTADAGLSVDGGALILTQALATNGSRYAAIVGPSGAGDVWSLNSARVTPPINQWALVLFGWGQTRFIALGAAAQPPFDLAFGTAVADAGLFVMANCSGDAGICAQTGSVIGFLAQP